MNKKSPFLLIQVSSLSVEEIANKIEGLLNSKQVTVFCRINHAQAAADVGLDLPPEIVLIFGSPKIGTSLMLEQPEIGIELPLKLLIWQQNHQTYVGYHDLSRQLEPYGIQQNKTIIDQMQQFMDTLVNSALAGEIK